VKTGDITAYGASRLFRSAKSGQKSPGLTGTIFPNLHFNELTPKIASFYRAMQIPTSALPCPGLLSGVQLRVSVNNFGFGGTNAHAILESYVPNGTSGQVVAPNVIGTHLSPFVLSGHSTTSLLGNRQALLKYLTDSPSVDLANLNWILQ
jgi:acyl transferase domain-containing protein